jgi:hypothetical protein
LFLEMLIEREQSSSHAFQRVYRGLRGPEGALRDRRFAAAAAKNSFCASKGGGGEWSCARRNETRAALVGTAAEREASETFVPDPSLDGNFRRHLHGRRKRIWQCSRVPPRNRKGNTQNVQRHERPNDVGNSEEVRIAFASHDVVVKGAGLDRLLPAIAAHRIVSLRESVRSERFCGQAERFISEIVIRRIEGEL